MSKRENEQDNKKRKGLQTLRSWTPIALACILLTAYSGKDGPTAPVLALSWRDKLDHFFVYALLATLVYQALPTKLRGTQRWFTAFILVSAFGIWDETLQHFNPARTGDPLDWLADSLGALVAAVFCSAFPPFLKLASLSPLSYFRSQKGL